MFAQLEGIENRLNELEFQMSNPDLVHHPAELRKLSQEHASLQNIVKAYREYKRITQEIQSTQGLLRDSDLELAAMAKEELKRLEQQQIDKHHQLQIFLLPTDPNDQKNVVLEIRAGAGGDEAALFVGELFRLYQRFSERQGWKVSLLSMSPTGLGGFKEIIAEIQGERVFSRLKWEGGVHRVQRVPETEAQGRVHTSTVTVAVLPEAEEVDLDIQAADLRIDVFRSGGAGGQGVNTTDSAVRITHCPSGLVVVCQDERSQLKNKDKAMKILRSRLLDLEREKAQKTHDSARKSMVGTGDRSERVRTYNFPQGRLTDHRIGLTLYQLSEVMEGKIEELIQALVSYYQIQALKEQGLES